MAVEYSWPSRAEAKVLGTSHDRLDGAAKTTGAAKYTYDQTPAKLLIARGLGCPHGHCRILDIDVTAAEKVPGVVHIHVLQKPRIGDDGKAIQPEIEWEGELLAVVAAETESAAAEGVAKIKIDFEPLDVFVDDENLEAAEKAGRTSKGGGRVQLEKEPGDDEDEDEFAEKEVTRLLGEAKHVVEGYYGIRPITHCCLEPHGSVCAWDGDKLNVHLSTQNVSGTDEQFANALKVAAGDVHVQCQYIGGGFGSKFAADYWGIACAEIAKATGRPVRLMLTRDQELKLGGNRPSGYLKVKLGADENGVVTVWDSQHWGTGGARGGVVGHGVIPYVYRPKNYRRVATAIKTNCAPARAWRAPDHPQACAISQTAYDDLAAKMGVDSYDIFLKNLANIESNQKAEVYTAEMEIAAKLMDWKAKWHPHGKGLAKGSVVEGLGMAIHTWQGVAGNSNCMLRVHPDGSVESFCGTQDLGTGTKTVCAMVLAETFGIPVASVKVNYGSSKYPESGPSGGSTTVGGVCESHRRAGQDALAQLAEVVAKKLEIDAATVVAKNGRVGSKDDDAKSLSWKEACSLLGHKALEVTARYARGAQGSPLSNAGVGGVQMAHVAVDRETGVVRMKKFVAVQDMGLVVNRKLAESQVLGAMIMGIAFALFEERITDPKTGQFVNAEMADYKLPRLGDIGELVVELYEPDSERARGVIGLGEPPVISPGAAISNAVCNALGVRVPVLPLTPKRVLDALAKAKA